MVQIVEDTHTHTRQQQQQQQQQKRQFRSQEVKERICAGLQVLFAIQKYLFFKDSLLFSSQVSVCRVLSTYWRNPADVFWARAITILFSVTFKHTQNKQTNKQTKRKKKKDVAFWRSCIQYQNICRYILLASLSIEGGKQVQISVKHPV